MSWEDFAMHQRAPQRRIGRPGGIMSLTAGVLLIVSVAAYAAPIQVTVISDAVPLKRAIAYHRGSVVVVSFWATWCGPCIAEFPDLVKLQNGRTHGLIVMAVSQDLPKDIKARVVPFLTQQNAHFPEFLIDTQDPNRFVNAFDPGWGGAPPETFVYDRKGRLARVLAGPQTLASYSAAVKPLLALQH